MKKDISQITTYESGVIQSAAHRLTMKIKADFLDQYDLSPTQWFVIGHVYDAGDDGIRLNDLKRILDSTMPFVTNLVNNLESKGLLYKMNTTDDSRVKVAKLNPKHKKLVQEIEAGLREKLRVELYSKDSITREELATYISVLYKITGESV
jgi:DNA-binding MarR family transcriptional regulator